MRKYEMKQMYRKISLYCVWVLLCTVLLIPFSAKAYEEKWGVINGTVNFREGPGSTYTSITKLAVGDSVYIIGEATADNGGLWYQVNCEKNGKQLTGYVFAEYITVGNNDFVNSLKEQGFPESYYAGLIALHEQYPSWQFKAVKTELSWDAVIAGETVIGRNMVYYTSNPAYIDLTDVDENGNQIGRDGYSWVTASKAAVEYYMDPRNFLNASNIFMFESLSYTEGAYTAKGVSAILSGTFMSDNYTCPDTKETLSYAETFLAAGKLSGVSPYHLASRAKQEQGSKGNALGTGTVSGYEGYYNFFNIGAFATSTGGATLNGAKYASSSGSYGRPWTNQYKSITGGAQFLGTSYINKGQDTIYFQKFNVVNKSNLYNHQYMSNVKAPASESTIMKKAYTDEILQGTLIFKIPVYENMPTQAVPKPEDRTEQPEQPTEPEDPDTTQTPSFSTSYRVSGTVLTGVAENTQVSTLLGKFSIENGSVALYNEADQKKSSGKVVTGDMLKILKTDGSVYQTLEIVIYGDINGDGGISIADLVLTRKHLMELSALSGSYYAAADINQDGKITIADMIFVRKHLMELSSITQA
jgi:beta-N-acetylglucosaminidase